MPGLNIWFSVLLAYAVKSAAIFAAAALLTLAMRRNSAAARHLVWTAAGIAVLALPVLTASVPALPIRGAAAAWLPRTDSPVFRATASASSESGPARPAAADAGSAPTPRRSLPWRTSITLLWALGSVALLVRMLAACAVAWRLRRASKPFEDSMTLVPGVDILETAPGTMPMTCGLLRPAVFLPSDAVQWTTERRHVVLAHELAHVSRGDFLTHLLFRSALALHWWNPLAWYAWREFLKEAERAADDLVLNSGAGAADYAEHLLSIARAMASPPKLAASIAMARRSQLEARLTSILDPGVNRRGPSRAWALSGVLAAIAIVAPLAAVRAQDKPTAQIPTDVQGAIRSAQSQRNPQILEDAAKAAHETRQFEIERQLLESAVELRGQVSGSGSVEYGKGLLKLGDLESRRGNFATGFYSRAVKILGATPDTAQALVYLGIDALQKAQPADAGNDFQQALNADPAHRGLYTALIAVSRSREGQREEADTMFREALALAESIPSDFLMVAELYHPTDEAERLELQARVIRASAAVAAQQRPAPKTDALKVGAGVTAPKPIESPEPKYSEAGRVLKIQGSVLLSIEIGPDGVPRNIQVVRGLGFGLNEAAADTVSRWRFQPGTHDGQPAAVAATIQVSFRLL